MAQSIKLLTRSKIFTEAETDDRALCLSTVGSATAQDLADIQEALGISTSAALITGATDIGAALADGDLLYVHDLSEVANRKSAVSRVWTYVKAKIDAGLTIAGAQIFSGLVTLNGGLALDKTITAAATVGAQTINKAIGSVNFDVAATSLVVTNSLVTANSVILATVATNDATMTSVQAVAGTGSFTLYANAAATAETRVNFLVLN